MIKVQLFGKDYIKELGSAIVKKLNDNKDSEAVAVMGVCPWRVRCQIYDYLSGEEFLRLTDAEYRIINDSSQNKDGVIKVPMDKYCTPDFYVECRRKDTRPAEVRAVQMVNIGERMLSRLPEPGVFWELFIYEKKKRLSNKAKGDKSGGLYFYGRYATYSDLVLVMDTIINNPIHIMYVRAAREYVDKNQYPRTSGEVFEAIPDEEFVINSARKSIPEASKKEYVLEELKPCEQMSGS